MSDLIFTEPDRIITQVTHDQEIGILICAILFVMVLLLVGID